jgi:hypothetical protein
MRCRSEEFIPDTPTSPMKAKFWRWILLFGLAGLIVPGVLLLHVIVSRTVFGGLEVLLWPGSLMLWTLENPKPPMVQAAIFAGALISNVLLYAAVGALTWLVRGR